MSKTKNKNSVKFSQKSFALLITIILIVVSTCILLNYSPVLAIFYLCYVPMLVLLTIMFNWCRDEQDEIIWLRPVLIFVFSLLFVGYLLCEISDNNYVKYDEYKKVIQSNPDFSDKSKYSIQPDFDKMERDAVIRNYEMMQVSDAMNEINSVQQTMKDKDQAQKIKVNLKNKQ